jgi:hypothetical protein
MTEDRRIAQYPRVYQDALAYWCAFRNLGFSADHIFLGFGKVDLLPDCLFIQLQTQGRQFTVTVEHLPGTKEEEVSQTWQNIAESLQSSSVEERNAVYGQHRIGYDFSYYTAFVLAIQNKGIVIPELSTHKDKIS